MGAIVAKGYQLEYAVPTTATPGAIRQSTLALCVLSLALALFVGTVWKWQLGHEITLWIIAPVIHGVVVAPAILGLFMILHRRITLLSRSIRSVLAVALVTVFPALIATFALLLLGAISTMLAEAGPTVSVGHDRTEGSFTMVVVWLLTAFAASAGAYKLVFDIDRWDTLICSIVNTAGYAVGMIPLALFVFIRFA